MTRISVYSKDVDVRGNDKWIGSDAQNQNRTKNFTPDNVAVYFNENQVIDLGVELRYFYDTLDPLQERVYGSITFETEIGPQVNFSAISTFILSKYTMGHTDVSQFLDFLVGSNVILSRSNNINMFGYYKIDSIEPYLPDPNFFVVTLTFETGNGYMKEDEDYFISLVQFEQELPATPTLQSVTDAGDTTTTTVHLDGGALSDSINEQASFTPALISTVNKNTGSGATLDSTGSVSISKDGIVSGILTVDDIVNDVTLQFPNKPVGDYTIATTEDLPAVQLVALPFTTDHLTATNNPYVIGDVVWYLGNVYRCIANNDSILPTSTTYWTNLGTGNPLVAQPSDWNATSGNNQILNKPTIPDAGVTSVGLTMPSAFSVANSPITSSGTLEVTGAGLVSQYVRGDGSLANFPTSTGGGASLSFYLNGSVSQGTIGGVAFREMDRTPILGAGTDFTISSNGYIQSFITDANVPNLLEIPAGNWNFETYFSASSGGGSPSFYLELYKWNGTTLSLIASNSANPEGITNGTAIDLYVSALAVPQTTLLATDRLAVRIYVTTSGRTIKLHTEDNHLCQVITTFSTGITALNGLTTQVQSFATGTSGTDFSISSATATHTFNLPTASAANRGALSSTDWSTFNGKFTLPALTSGSVLFSNGTTIAQDNSNLFWDDTNNRLGIGTATPTSRLHIAAQGALSTDIAFKIRNSANTADILNVNGLGVMEMINTALSLQLLNTTGVGVQFRNGAGSTSYTLRGWNTNTGVYTPLNIDANPLNLNTLSNSNVIFGSGNVLINTTTDAGFKLDVNGTARVSGNTTFGTLGTGTGMFWDNTNNGLTLGGTTLDSNIIFQINGSKGARISGTGAGFGYSLVRGSETSSFLNSASAGVLSSTTTLAFNTAATIRVLVNSSGNILINTTSDVPSSKLTIASTTQGFLPPRMTTTQKNAIATPAAGLMVYDTTLNLISVYNGTMWISL